MKKELTISMKGISKAFGNVVAVHNANLELYSGEILSLLGENGSGKTSLMNVLAGIYFPDEGEIFYKEKKISINSPADAYKYQIGMVHQHFKLVDTFTAVENVVTGLRKKDYQAIAESEGEKYQGYNLKTSAKRIEKICKQFGFEIDPWQVVNTMSVSEKQTLEIIKILFRGVNILILDEPTAVLTPQETQHLFKVLRNMKKAGKSIIIITHKLNEVLEISDRVVVLRKGEVVGDILTKKANEEILTEMMVGHKIDLNIHRSEVPNTGVRLKVRDLSLKNREGRKVLKNVSFDLHGSEILGIAGISGSGQKELLETIAGLNKNTEGTVIFHNPKKDRPVTFYHKNIKQIRALAKENKFYTKDQSPLDLTPINNKQLIKMVNDEEILFYEDEIIDLKGKKPIEIRDLGIKLSFVPEDRLGMGLVGNMDIIDNMMLRSFRKGKGFFVHRQQPEKLAEQVVGQLDVKTPNLTTTVKKLSGGNIQKILVGREISSQPKVLMVAYPVRGLDINSSFLIYKLLNEQKERDAAIIYVGEDLDIILALCDRVLVLADGEVAGILDCRKTNKLEVGLLMTKKNDKEENRSEQ
ncbi:MAG TPA: ABC transporter ATP-binding protein [Erysipelotrichaceae bacterium]|nr:ABC transporter ATP-binding protein [Erysipelotrichaceae bacterium]